VPRAFEGIEEAWTTAKSMVEDKLGTRFGRGSAASLGTRPRDTVAIGQLFEMKIICAALYFPKNLNVCLQA
jgi:hypothetical protein